MLQLQHSEKQVHVNYPWVEMASKIWATKATREVREYQLKHWVRWMKDNEIQGLIDFEDINQYLFEMRKSSQAQRKIALKKAIKAHPLIENNVSALAMVEEKFKQIRTVKSEERIRESQYLTKSEIDAILEELYRLDTQRSLKTAILIESLFQTACRASELIGMDHSDVTRLKDRVEIKILGKNSKMRTVMMSDFLYEMIRSHFSKRGPLFTSERGQVMTRHGLHQQVLYVSKKYVGRKLGPHALRHSKAMEMLERGVSIKKVSGYLGHSDVATTLRYYVHETATHGDVLG